MISLSRTYVSRKKKQRIAAAIIFGLGLLLAYLTLAAQFESLVLPFIILLAVPLAVLGALLAQWGRGLINDVYCQIGLLMLIGLSAKQRSAATLIIFSHAASRCAGWPASTGPCPRPATTPRR